MQGCHHFLISHIEIQPRDQERHHERNVFARTNPHGHIQPRLAIGAERRGVIHAVHASLGQQDPQDGEVVSFRDIEVAAPALRDVDRVVNGVVPRCVAARHDTCAVVQQRGDHAGVGVEDSVVEWRAAAAVGSSGVVTVAHHGVEVDAEGEEPQDQGQGVGIGEDATWCVGVVVVQQHGGEDVRQ